MKTNKGVKMKNKLSKCLINYIKKRNGIDLTNVPSDKSWTELNPLRDIEQLPSNVVEFLNQKHNKEKGDK